MRLIGVGVGPGDPELVTLKAARVLATADRVFVPVLDPADTGRAEANVAGHTAPERIERLVFALDRGQRDRYWAAAGERVARWLRSSGGTAAFATIGDPNIYSTFGYLARAVRASLPDVVVQTVPGITAMQALASASGTVLTEGNEPLVLLPLPDGGARIADALAGDATVVVYKGGRHLPEIAEAVAAAGRPAVLGSHVGLPDEHIAPLSDLDGPVAYLSTVLIPAARDGSRRPAGGQL
jgi:precorrin-2/cobalt-factor-2 C20-methyltransferase